MRALKSKRHRDEYDDVAASTQYERRREGAIALSELKVPPSALAPVIAPPHELLHTSCAERKRIRSVDSVSIASEKQMAEYREFLAGTHATRTADITGEVKGAYVEDPLRLLRILSENSRDGFLVIGGDGGGGTVKIGATYLTARGTLQFTPLLVAELNESPESLHRLASDGDVKTPFIEDSKEFDSIWDVLQHVIDSSESVLLNGDWKWINTVVGLKSPSSTHPCPICVVDKDDFLQLTRAPHQRAIMRTHRNNPSTLDDFEPLLHIYAGRIVPTPLHVYLGVCNRILKKVMPLFVGKAVTTASIARVKQIHSAGRGGLADLYDLNGPELDAWLRHNTDSSLITEAATAAVSIQDAAKKLAHRDMQMKAMIQLPIVIGWMRTIRHAALHAEDWSQTDVTNFSEMITLLQTSWVQLTGDTPFPKLHMLSHFAPFARRHGFLGRAAESQIESAHAKVNQSHNNNHVNMSRQPSTRIRRSLVGVLLKAVQPIVTP